MPILDSIQAAEKKAEQMKSEATEKVRVLLENTKLQTEVKVKRMFEEAHKEEVRNEEETQNQIKSLEKKINSLYEKQDQDTVLLAESRMNMAIDFIIKKVLEI